MKLIGNCCAAVSYDSYRVQFPDQPPVIKLSTMQRFVLTASNTQSTEIKAVTHEVGHRGGWVIHNRQGRSQSHGTRGRRGRAEVHHNVAILSESLIKSRWNHELKSGDL